MNERRQNMGLIWLRVTLCNFGCNFGVTLRVTTKLQQSYNRVTTKLQQSYIEKYNRNNLFCQN